MLSKVFALGLPDQTVAALPALPIGSTGRRSRESRLPVSEGPEESVDCRHRGSAVEDLERRQSRGTSQVIGEFPS